MMYSLYIRPYCKPLKLTPSGLLNYINILYIRHTSLKYATIIRLRIERKKRAGTVYWAQKYATIYDSLNDHIPVGIGWSKMSGLNYWHTT